MPAAVASANPPDADLLEKAEGAARRAYARYSNFQVGCAVRTATGAIHVGCNVENESFPATICAERAALAAAVAAEGPDVSVKQVLVYAIGSDGRHTNCAPCGICCQVIGEIAPDASVGFFSNDRHVTVTGSALLPHAFRGQLK